MPWRPTSTRSSNSYRKEHEHGPLRHSPSPADGHRPRRDRLRAVLDRRAVRPSAQPETHRLRSRDRRRVRRARDRRGRAVRLTEGLPAAGLAIVSIALARAARRSGAAEAARVALIAGGAAALISLLQFALGAALAVTTTSATAHLLYEAVNRLDGVKMLALAGLGLAGAASGALPRWLRYTGIGLAIAIAASSVAYLLLVQGLAVLAVPAGVLLLVFIIGTSITLGTSTNKPSRNTPAARKADAEAGALS
jgi:hypothetical protein